MAVVVELEWLFWSCLSTRSGRHFWCLVLGSSYLYDASCRLRMMDGVPFVSNDGFLRSFDRKVEHMSSMADSTAVPQSLCALCTFVA